MHQSGPGGSRDMTRQRYYRGNETNDRALQLPSSNIMAAIPAIVNNSALLTY